MESMNKRISPSKTAMYASIVFAATIIAIGCVYSLSAMFCKGFDGSFAIQCFGAATAIYALGTGQRYANKIQERKIEEKKIESESIGNAYEK
jgi:hypothetical protein